MPFTGAAFLVGAVAICGLPPLNGFVSEWLIYLGASARSPRRADGGDRLARCARRARSRAHRRARRRLLRQGVRGRLSRQPAQPVSRRQRPEEASRSMSWSMAASRGRLRRRSGSAPRRGARRLRRSAASSLGGADAAAPASASSELAALRSCSSRSSRLTAVAAASFLRPRNGAPDVTWDCGYAAADARECSTRASSFAQMLGRLLPLGAPADGHRPVTRRPLFPEPAHFESHVPDPVLDRFILPSLWPRTTRLRAWRAYLRPGTSRSTSSTSSLTLVVLLAWSSAW